jgi:peptidoglycan/LPS O-acetylase OafA/YrhL
MKKSSWVNGLDSLRFFLALVVVLSHMPNSIAIALKESGNVILRNIGYAVTPVFCGVGAVIAFFIISGFVIHYPNKDKEVDYLNFLSRRWVRLGIPMIAVGVVATYFDMFGKIPIWSLYCELIYYTLYPLMVKLKISWKAKFWISFGIASGLIAVLCGNDILSLVNQKDVNFSGSYWQLGDGLTWIVGLPCWLLGVMLAEKVDKVDYKVSIGNIMTWRMVVFLTSVFIQVVRFKFFVSWAVSMNLFAFLLFFWIEREIIYYRQHSSSPFFERLGKFSYSLYLVHELVVLFILQFMPLNAWTYFVVVALIVFSSYLIFLVLEKPSHMLAQKVRIGKKRQAAVS